VIVLASASPRRRALLEAAGVALVVRPATVDETWREEDPVGFARRLASAKVDAVAGDVRLGADTVVHRDGLLFDKPADDVAAVDALAALSGGWHEVTTAFAVVGRRRVEGAVHTRVRFRTLTAGEIRAYVASGEARDKAGAYGIQGAGGALVAEIRGSYTNVVGLPLEEVLAALAEATR
jgi:septum formation protein